MNKLQMQINGLLKIIRVLIVGLCLTACDMASTLFVNDVPAYSISSECGTVKITGTSFCSDYITFTFTGDFIVNIDSLKISINNHPIENKKVKISYKKKLLEDVNRTIHVHGYDTITFIINNGLPIQCGENNFAEILPSSFIMCNETPLITNVIRMRVAKKKQLKSFDRIK